MATDNLMPQSSTSIIKHFMLRSSTTGQGLTGKVHSDFTGKYNIAGGAEVTLSFSSGTAGDSYSSGKICPLGLGKYAWHVPNAVFASLGNVSAVLSVTGGIDVHCEWLVVADSRDLATKSVNVTQFGGANGTFASGVPEVKVASMAADSLNAAAISADAGAELAALVEAYIVNEGDATAVMQAIADKIATDWVAGDASPLAIATAVWGAATRTITGGSLTTAPATAAAIADAVWDESRSGHTTDGTFGFYVDAAITSRLAPTVSGRTLNVNTSGEGDAELDSGALLNTLGLETGNLDEQLADILAASGGGGGGSATAENQTTIIGHLTDIKGTGWSSATDTLKKTRDAVSNLISTSVVVPGPVLTAVGMPATLEIGDSYEEESCLTIYIRDENDDPVSAAVGHDFTDGDFAPTFVIAPTPGSSRGRVKGIVTYVDPGGSDEPYLKVEIPSSQSKLAVAGEASVQLVLKWTGAEKTLLNTTVIWLPRI